MRSTCSQSILPVHLVYHEHTFSGTGPKNGMADVMQATQSATKTMPVMGSGAHEVNPHGITPTPKSVTKLLNDVKRELMMFRIQSASNVVSSSSLVVAVDVEEVVPVLRASVSKRGCWHSNATTRARR